MKKKKKKKFNTDTEDEKGKEGSAQKVFLYVVFNLID